MIPRRPAHDCWFLTGPTASGKTGLGVRLAQRLGAEIVSLDSMAIYREMDIGTAKPTPADREAVPHHLLDLVDPAEEFSVAAYLAVAEAKIAEIRAAGREVLFVGGTPLYLKALLRGLFDGPGADWEFRRQIEEELATVGQESLHARLKSIDPLAASRVHPHDRRRLIRALEVYKLTGRPISHQQMEFDEGLPAEACRVFVLDRARAELHARIARRVDGMFQAGFIDEVRTLLARPRPLGRTASQAVGYREVIDYLAGRFDLSEAAERVRGRTRRFAKRQSTWFNSLSECRFLPVEGEIDPEALVERIVALGSGSSPPL